VSFGPQGERNRAADAEATAGDQRHHLGQRVDVTAQLIAASVAETSSVRRGPYRRCCRKNASVRRQASSAAARL
jgi:hypothetical protein